MYFAHKRTNENDIVCSLMLCINVPLDVQIQLGTCKVCELVY